MYLPIQKHCLTTVITAGRAYWQRKNTRGTIYSSNGDILAQTVKGEDGKEVRNYPYDNMFAHIVGYSTKGKTGLESLANYYLINTSATVAQQAENSAAGRKKIREIICIPRWI